MAADSVDPNPSTPLDALYGRMGQYYAEKIRTHGPTPMGVDWPCGLTQKLRFVQLLKFCEPNRTLVINDLGCGYGALLGFLRERYRRRRIQYHGVDVCAEMIDAARTLWQGDPCSTFTVGRRPHTRADYSVASGIFNVKLNESDKLWARSIRETIGHMLASSEIGIAVNFLAALPSESNGKSELYRTSPEVWVRHCELDHGATAQVVSNYGIQEFTLVVRHARNAHC